MDWIRVADIDGADKDGGLSAVEIARWVEQVAQNLERRAEAVRYQSATRNIAYVEVVCLGVCCAHEA
jgi:hypothetical protein